MLLANHLELSRIILQATIYDETSIFIAFQAAQFLGDKNEFTSKHSRVCASLDAQDFADNNAFLRESVWKRASKR